MPPNQPPYAVPAIEFRFPALAALAGRAQLGGDREVAIVIYLAARLAHDTAGDTALSDAARVERAATARTWLSTFTLPATVRALVARLIENTSAGDASTIVADLRDIVASAQQYLDIQSRAELEQLARTIATATPSPS